MIEVPKFPVSDRTMPRDPPFETLRFEIWERQHRTPSLYSKRNHGEWFQSTRQATLFVACTIACSTNKADRKWTRTSIAIFQRISSLALCFFSKRRVACCVFWLPRSTYPDMEARWRQMGSSFNVGGYSYEVNQICFICPYFLHWSIGCSLFWWIRLYMGVR